jgi:hypothetical protein
MALGPANANVVAIFATSNPHSHFPPNPALSHRTPSLLNNLMVMASAQNQTVSTALPTERLMASLPSQTTTRRLDN